MDWNSIATEEEDFQCPYCLHWHEATGSYEEDQGKWECESCGKYFLVDVEYEPYYHTRKLFD